MAVSIAFPQGKFLARRLHFLSWIHYSGLNDIGGRHEKNENRNPYCGPFIFSRLFYAPKSEYCCSGVQGPDVQPSLGSVPPDDPRHEFFGHQHEPARWYYWRRPNWLSLSSLSALPLGDGQGELEGGICRVSGFPDGPLWGSHRIRTANRARIFYGAELSSRRNSLRQGLFLSRRPDMIETRC
jgi:hypothetical protein